MKTHYFLIWSDEMSVCAVVAANTTKELNAKIKTALNEHYCLDCRFVKKAELIEDFDETQEVVVINEGDRYEVTIQKTWLY